MEMQWKLWYQLSLSHRFHNLTCHSEELRREAKDWLFENAVCSSFIHMVLRYIIADLSSVPAFEQIRHTAAVFFKDQILHRWSPTLLQGPISDYDKEEIKSLIVHLMLSPSSSSLEIPYELKLWWPLSPSLKIPYVLGRALSEIGKHDFPRSWPALLPELISILSEAAKVDDYSIINGVLMIVNSLFKKFRNRTDTNDEPLLVDLKYCLDNFAAPLCDIFSKNAAPISSAAAAASTPAALQRRLLLESQRLCCRIFYSLLNFNQELLHTAEYFKDHMKEWMFEFRKYLTESYPEVTLIKGEAGGKGWAHTEEYAVVDELRAAVCDNVSLLMEKKNRDENFQALLKDFVPAVYNLLVSSHRHSSRADRVILAAIKFLTMVSNSEHHHTLFAGKGVIPQICHRAIPNLVQLRDEDKELLCFYKSKDPSRMNYFELIEREMKGGVDAYTRRTIVGELIEGIATNYEYQIRAVVFVQIQSLLDSYAAYPHINWKDKECAIYLFASLATEEMARVSSISPDIADDVGSFFGSYIVPELQSQNVNGLPMLKAGALKFFTMFRNQISKPVAMAVVPHVVHFLCAKASVVHSYAAICIEKLLIVKDDEEEGRARYTSIDFNPFALVLMANLFNALKFPESEGNPYIMKCIMRVLGVVDISQDIAKYCITSLTNVIGIVCKDLKDPVFDYYLFESVAVLVRRACEHDSSLLPDFEAGLFPSLEMIIDTSVIEFFPYLFQLVALFVELNGPPIPLPSIYMSIFFNEFVSIYSWKMAANVPALVRLLHAFLQKAPPDELQRKGGMLDQLLDLFRCLVISPSTDEQGFYVLDTVVQNLGYDVIAPYTRCIWDPLFMRLQDSRTGEFLKSLLIFMSLFLVKYGSARLLESMNFVQPNIFIVILEHYWIPNLNLITGANELKLTSVASTNLLCESPALLDAATINHWGKMLGSILTLISRPEQEDRVEEEEPDIGKTLRYTDTFIPLPLYTIGKKDDDLLNDIKNPKKYVISSLASLCARFPGRFSQIISEQLDPINQTALRQLCSTYKISLV